MIVRVDHASTVGGWQRTVNLPRVPVVGELLTGPPPARDLYVVSVVHWRPWGLKSRTRSETAPHVLVLVRTLTAEHDLESDGLAARRGGRLGAGPKLSRSPRI